MAKLPPIQRISTEDFKEQSGWIDKLLAPLNSYFERTTTALNRGLTINDNMAAEIRTVELDGVYPIKLAWTLKARPIAVVVGAIYRATGADYTQASAVQVQWRFNQAGQLQIDGLVGSVTPTPSSTAKYRIVLLCFTG